MPIAATSVSAERVVLTLRGDLDAAISWELDVWLDVAMEGRRRVVLDTSALRRLDPTALGVITDARERFRRAGGELLVSPGAVHRRPTPLVGREGTEDDERTTTPTEAR